MSINQRDAEPQADPKHCVLCCRDLNREGKILDAGHARSLHRWLVHKHTNLLRSKEYHIGTTYTDEIRDGGHQIIRAGREVSRDVEVDGEVARLRLVVGK